MIDSLGYNICYTARKIYHSVSKNLENLNITPEQWAVLKKLSEEEEISQKELSIKMDKDQNTIKAIIDRLEKKEYIKRLPNPKDKRAFLLILTEKAKENLVILKSAENEALKNLYTGLSEDDIKNLETYLEIIRKNIEK